MAMTWVAVAAFVLVGALIEFVRRLAVQLALTDRPDTRKSHERPTPYPGVPSSSLTSSCRRPSRRAEQDPRPRLLLVAAAAVVLGLVPMLAA